MLLRCRVLKVFINEFLVESNRACIYRFHPFILQLDEVKAIHGTNERIAIESVINSVKLSKALIQSAVMP